VNAAHCIWPALESLTVVGNFYPKSQLGGDAMNATLVADIKVGSNDFNGNQIQTVYGAVSKLYAVYRAADRVYVHFADDPTQGANQRAALSPLAILRSEVEARIERIRSREYRFRSEAIKAVLKASAYSRAGAIESRLARILLTALQGDDKGALAQLTALRDEMNEKRASEIRSWHLFYAALATLATIGLCWGLSAPWFNETIHDFGDYSPEYWNASAIGAIGALFSIALQLRARAVPVDLQSWDNFCDAILRIFIGAVSATILYALFFGGLVSLQIGGEPLQLAATPKADLACRVVLAFTAGFTERLVADFVGGFTLAKAAKPPTPTPNASAAEASRNEYDVARGTIQQAKAQATPAADVRSLTHDPNVPNRIEADDIADVAKIIGGKLDPMEGQA
jgi:hypothetical protein